MSRTSTLRRQHDAAVELVGKILERSQGPAMLDNAYQIGLLMARLTGLLRIHFAQEDKSLYPYMLACSSVAASTTARRFQSEMGGLAGAFDAFTKRWDSSNAIAADFAGFRTQCNAIFTALGDRVRRENEELYPLADAIEPDMVRRTA